MSMVDELPPLGEGDTLYDELFNERMEQKWQLGIEQGQRQALMTAIHNMLQQGLDTATIARYLSLDEAEVLQIQAELS